MLTRIAPIGTSRVFLPIRNLHQRGMAWLIAARNYGYVFSPAEALQQARFVTGNLDTIPADLFPMIATMDSDAPRMSAAPVRPEVYLVEISSRRALKDPSGLYLRGNLSQNEKSRAEAVQIDNPALKSYMTQIVELLGQDRVCFVTHINGVATDGKTILARERLIEATVQIANSLDVAVINPTELLDSHKQRDLLDEDSTYLNHYREDAIEIVADFYLRKLQDFSRIKQAVV